MGTQDFVDAMSEQARRNRLSERERLAEDIERIECLVAHDVANRDDHDQLAAARRRLVEIEWYERRRLDVKK
jgi:hypothetical protein